MSLCVHIVEQETGRGGRGVAGCWKALGGGLKEAGLPKQITPPPPSLPPSLFYRCQGIVKAVKKESRPSREPGRQIFVRVKHCCFLPFVWRGVGRRCAGGRLRKSLRISGRWMVFLVTDYWFLWWTLLVCVGFGVARLVGLYGQHFIIFKSSFDLCSCGTKRTRGVINPPLPHLFLDYP